LQIIKKTIPKICKDYLDMSTNPAKLQFNYITMKKNTQRYFFLLGFVALVFGLTSCKTKYKPMLSSQEGINFKVVSLSDAKRVAKEENKPLFVFAHASWCPTCKRMEHEVLNQKAIGDIYNKEFVNVAIDIDSQDGHQLNSQFPIRATPTLLFFNADGSLARKVEGYTVAGDLLLVENQLKH